MKCLYLSDPYTLQNMKVIMVVQNTQHQHTWLKCSTEVPWWIWSWAATWARAMQWPSPHFPQNKGKCKDPTGMDYGLLCTYVTYVHGEMRCSALWTTLMLKTCITKIMSTCVSENSNLVHLVGFDECLMSGMLSAENYVQLYEIK